VLIFRRRVRPLVAPALADPYRAFVARGFRHGLGTVAPAAAIRRVAGTGATARELDAHQWAALFAGSLSRSGSQPSAATRRQGGRRRAGGRRRP
jgi:hypothetical protein